MMGRMEPLLAHVEPDEPLLDHLRAVGRQAQAYLEPLDGTLGRLGWIAGAAHDLGKATPFFQDYLRGRKGKELLTSHSLPGALLGAWWAMGEGWGSLDALLVFLAIHGHHGSLRTPWEVLKYDVTELRPDRVPPGLRGTSWGVLPEQLRVLEGPLGGLAQELGLPDPKPFLEGEWRKVLRRLYEDADRLIPERLDPGVHFRLGYLYSALVDADRRLSARTPPSPQEAPIPKAAVEAYLRAKPKPSSLPQALVGLREGLWRGMEEALERPLKELFPSEEPSPRFLSLTAPTGAGKTLAALSLALGLRERVWQERGFRPKVVYALPFINIADQVEEEVRGVLQGAGLDPDQHLLVHHHLAPARWQGPGPADQDFQSLEEALLLRETWEREVVVTTFHGLVGVLLGTEPASLRPLHGLGRGAILILDEVQAIPAEWWPLFRRVFQHLPGWMTVISMTATQPALLPAPRELAPPLQAPQRVWFQASPAKRLEELAQEVAQRGGLESTLVVLNTVREAVELYRLLKGMGLPHLYHLSSHLIPKHRQEVLRKVRDDLRAGKPVVLVATQVVEAGVDLDFAQGFRAMAPLDSLVQTAGRINRHGLREMGRLWVVDLEGGSDRRVYGEILMHRTRRVLSGPLEEGIWDRDVSRLLSEYFRQVEEAMGSEKSKEFAEHLETLHYDRLRDFELLTDVPRLPIFVEWDHEASHLVDELERTLAIGEPLERRKRLKVLYPKLEAYTVSPLLPRAAKNLPPPLLGREDWRHVPRDGLDSYYDPEVGFIWQMEQFL